MAEQTYFRYWGKTTGHAPDAGCHLLAFHSLDVAACCQVLLKLRAFQSDTLAKHIGWQSKVTEQVQVTFAALHDLGKFARSFQGLASFHSPALVPPDPRKRYSERHDTLGWLGWQELAGRLIGKERVKTDGDFWNQWMRATTGHHGKPPRESTHGGLFGLRAADHFLAEDLEAAGRFLEEVSKILLPQSLPPVDRKQQVALRKHSWRIAGVMVLADWIASGSPEFCYRSAPMELLEYWRGIALPAAERAVAAAGLLPQRASLWNGASEFLAGYSTLTPLQNYAATAAISSGPQMFLLEDVTGAGKTEAALLLTHRLMAAGNATGAYFALPTMATANQMYRRVGCFYRKLYNEQSTPSLVLAHGARKLVDEFRESVLSGTNTGRDGLYGTGDQSAGLQCSAWLADRQKKALLADIGVGTVDQALLAVLPVRHQSLRLLGLSSKVLVVDEVHAYDAYTSGLLQRLIEAHALQGGSIVLLSATVPSRIRQELVNAFLKGCGGEATGAACDSRYPLATKVSTQGGVEAISCDTREMLKRRVPVQFLHEERDAADAVLREARAGRCVCWIRNTVEDARRAFAELAPLLLPHQVQLFHSRFVMHDRLAIENEVLANFGASSGSANRSGRVLVATQVVEQSLDLDFDAMITDLAPVDLMIQRAGRLQRHIRAQNGDRANVEGRPGAVLHVHCPPWEEMPDAGWYARLFPKGRFVYPNAGTLWLSQRALQAAGSIVTPGQLGEQGSVRQLMEAVYGNDVDVPSGLQKATAEAMGKVMGDRSLANFNALRLEQGYGDQENCRWYEEDRVPTRLGEDSTTVYLARERNGELHPLADSSEFGWENSSLRVDRRSIGELSPAWQERFADKIAALRQRTRLFNDYVCILPLVQEEEHWMAQCETKAGQLIVCYDNKLGLKVNAAE